MWYSKVVADLGSVPDFIAYYENELAQAKYDIAIKGNRAKIEEIKATINAGRKTPATVRLIHDNDDSGRSTVQSFIDNGFKIEVFNWSLLKDVDTHKWDLKDLVYYLKDLGQDEDGIVEFLENKNNYKGNNNE